MKKEQKDFFSINNLQYIDYKDVELLKRFLTPHARMMSAKRTNLSGKHQRLLAEAIKRARFMGLLPFVSR